MIRALCAGSASSYGLLLRTRTASSGRAHARRSPMEGERPSGLPAPDFLQRAAVLAPVEPDVAVLAYGLR